jgi:hypothetical protein
MKDPIEALLQEERRFDPRARGASAEPRVETQELGLDPGNLRAVEE